VTNNIGFIIELNVENALLYFGRITGREERQFVRRRRGWEGIRINLNEIGRGLRLAQYTVEWLARDDQWRSRMCSVKRAEFLEQLNQ
jgi:hypothetical protein